MILMMAVITYYDEDNFDDGGDFGDGDEDDFDGGGNGFDGDEDDRDRLLCSELICS